MLEIEKLQPRSCSIQIWGNLLLLWCLRIHPKYSIHLICGCCKRRNRNFISLVTISFFFETHVASSSTSLSQTTFEWKLLSSSLWNGIWHTCKKMTKFTTLQCFFPNWSNFGDGFSLLLHVVIILLSYLKLMFTGCNLRMSSATGLLGFETGSN